MPRWLVCINLWTFDTYHDKRTYTPAICLSTPVPREKNAKNRIVDKSHKTQILLCSSIMWGGYTYNKELSQCKYYYHSMQAFIDRNCIYSLLLCQLLAAVARDVVVPNDERKLRWMVSSHQQRIQVGNYSWASALQTGGLFVNSQVLQLIHSITIKKCKKNGYFGTGVIQNTC